MPADLRSPRMQYHFLAIFAALFSCVASHASGTTVSIDTTAATAVLRALNNPMLTRQESLQIAQMTANQGIDRKAREFKVSVTPQDFANALYDSAHGVAATSAAERYFLFDRIKPDAAKTLSLVQTIASDPGGFQQPIETRIALFSPSDRKLELHGYIVAGGDGGGYAFGGTDFYLNIGMMNELLMARTTTAHELYHAVQGAFAKERGALDELPDLSSFDAGRQSCMKTRQLFGNLYEEGSAMYVEDGDLLKQAKSSIGKKQEEDLRDGIQHAGWSAALLEMSVISLTATPAMSYDDVYNVDFYGHGALYSLGLLMAQALAEAKGPAGLGMYLSKSPQQFVLAYIALPLYGKDKEHPALGPHTVAAAQQMPDTCEAH